MASEDDKAALIVRAPDGTIAGRKLSERQEHLSRLLASGVPKGEAAKLAGYPGYRGDGSRASRSPAVAARVVELQRLRIGRTGALAIKVIEDILTGRIEAPASVRLDAGKYVLRINGVEATDDKSKENKDLRTMTLEELYEAARRVRDKTEPARPGDDAQVIDIAVESTT